MARPSKSTPDDWKPAKDWTSLLKRLRCAIDSEDSAVDQLRLQLLTETLHLMIGCAPFTRASFEFQLGQYGIVDLLLHHADGGYTLVEAKGPVTVREACAGIGQLFSYEAGLRAMLQQENKEPTYIDKVLCAPLPPSRAKVVGEVCAGASVNLVLLAPAVAVQELAAGVDCGS